MRSNRASPLTCARVEERVFIESEPERVRQVVPDVYLHPGIYQVLLCGLEP